MMLDVRPLFSVFNTFHLLWRNPVLACNLAARAWVNPYCYNVHRLQFLWAFSAPVLVGYLSRCPSTIIGHVATIVINSIKHQVAWAFTHVDKEILKQFPTVTNRYSASDVVCSLWEVGVGAARHHVAPRMVGLGFASSAGVAVLNIGHRRSVR